MSYRRIDASDPRRPDLTRPLVLPKAWVDDDFDIYASLLGSASMMSGAAIMTRVPQIAYLGLIFACAHLAHDKKYKSSKTKESMTGGPWMSLCFSLLSFVSLLIPKMSASDPLGLVQKAKGLA